MSIPVLPPIKFDSEEDRQKYIKEMEKDFDKEDTTEPYHSHWINSPRIVSVYPLMIL